MSKGENFEGYRSIKAQLSGAAQTIAEIAQKAASEIHWHHVKPPDAYGQEDAARTTKIIIRAIRHFCPIPTPKKFT